MTKAIAALSFGIALGLAGALRPLPIFSPCLAVCYDAQCRDTDDVEACAAECAASCEIYD